MVCMTYQSPAGWDGLVAKARRPGGTSAASIPVTGSGLDSPEQNAAIGLVTSATASIMAGSLLRLVRRPGKYVARCPDCPDSAGLTPHAYIPIDSNTGHVLVETEADKEYCKTECCRHHTGRQPASHANEWPL